jgi:membrane protein DedA with SNARE-associated domain
MPYRRFLPWNLAGGLAWGALSSLAGYWGGRNGEKIIHRAGLAGIAAAVVVLSVLFVAWRRFRRKAVRRSVRARLRARSR